MNNFFKKKIFKHFYQIKKNPVIVLGNQKSGTSVIAHLLSDYGGLTKTIDIPEIWWPKLYELLKREIDLKTFVTENRHQFSTDLIKEPNLTFFYPELVKIYPKANFVFVVRDPRSNIRSMFDRLKLSGKKEELTNKQIAKIPTEWRHIFDAELWKLPSNKYVETVAWRWVKIANVYLENKVKMHLIRFEDFLDDKVSEISNLAKDLGIHQKTDITPKMDKQYQPRGNRNVEWDEFFGERNLNHIEEICGDYMKEFGYEPILEK